MGGGQRHRPRTLYDGTGKAQALVVTIPPAAGGTHGRADGDGVQRDDRLQAAERQSGPLPVRDRGRHDLGLERRDAGDRDVHGPRTPSTRARPSPPGDGAATSTSTNFASAASTSSTRASTGSGWGTAATTVTASLRRRRHGRPRRPTLQGRADPPGLLALQRAEHRRQTSTSPSPRWTPRRTDDVPGAGLGYVDVFSPERQAPAAPRARAVAERPVGPGAGAGRLRRLQPQPAGGPVRQRRDRRLRRGDRAASSARCRTPTSAVLSIEGLWALSFGNGATAGPLNTLYFTAGIDDEAHGLFGSLTPVSAALARQRAVAASHPGEVGSRRKPAPRLRSTSPSRLPVVFYSVQAGAP